MKHSSTVLSKDNRTLQFATKSWSAEFRCPTCGAAQRANLNFLGRRQMVCDGERITKQVKAA